MFGYSVCGSPSTSSLVSACPSSSSRARRKVRTASSAAVAAQHRQHRVLRRRQHVQIRLTSSGRCWCADRHRNDLRAARFDRRLGLRKILVFAGAEQQTRTESCAPIKSGSSPSTASDRNHDFQPVAARELGRGVQTLRHDLAVTLDGDALARGVELRE